MGLDFLYGSFGKGLYFRSTLPEMPGQKVLLCKAALGRVEMISKSKHKTTIQLKRNPDYDSVKVIFRLISIVTSLRLCVLDSRFGCIG